MSTALQDRGFLNRESRSPDSERHFLVSFAEGFEREQAQQTIRYTRASRPKSAEQRKPNFKVVRRFRGFVVELGSSDARVAFVENGETFLYDLPVDHLRRSGISIRNQPFEMDEVEMQTDIGLVVGHIFRALAKPADAYIEPLTFDQEWKRKRDLILKTFAKA